MKMSLKPVKATILIILAIAVYSIFTSMQATRNNLSSWKGIQQKTPSLSPKPMEAFRETQLKEKEQEVNEHMFHDKITFVTQLSRDRLLMLKGIIDSWRGPISAVVVMKPDQYSDLDRFLAHYPNRNNILISPYNSSQIVNKNDYPVNALRNLALAQSKTPFVFLADVDFIPTQDTLDNLERSHLVRKFVAEGGYLNQELAALVIPAFRSTTRNITVSSKKDILDLLNNETISPFGFEHHLATNYKHWLSATEPYCVEPYTTTEYEPYVIVKYDSPRYDERFIGYGFNKIQQLHHLMWIGYQFVVLPDVAIVHLPHLRSSQYMFEGNAENNKHLWQKFQEEIWNKYGSPQFAQCIKISDVAPYVPVES